MRKVAGLVFAPLLALISMDPAAGRTVGPDSYGMSGSTLRKHGVSLERLLAMAGQDDKGQPLVPPAGKPRKGARPGSGQVQTEQPDLKPVADILRGGARHRKPNWPILDFAGHGKPRGTPTGGGSGGSTGGPGGSTGGPGGSGGGGGGGGGWDDAPDLDPVVDTGPGGHSGGPAGNGDDPYCPPDTISPVPVPAAGVMLVAALGGLAAVGRRRTRR